MSFFPPCFELVNFLLLRFFFLKDCSCSHLFSFSLVKTAHTLLIKHQDINRLFPALHACFVFFLFLLSNAVLICFLCFLLANLFWKLGDGPKFVLFGTTSMLGHQSLRLRCGITSSFTLSRFCAPSPLIFVMNLKRFANWKQRGHFSFRNLLMKSSRFAKISLFCYISEF